MHKTEKKVLIVEDEKDFLWVLRRSFDNQGLSIVYATNGEEGLAMAEKEKPDLILIDIKLPKMDGITMAKKIKEKGINSQMIFLTGFDDPDHISQAIEVAGQAGYIVKDDNVFKLVVDRVKDTLGLKK